MATKLLSSLLPGSIGLHEEPEMSQTNTFLSVCDGPCGVRQISSFPHRTYLNVNIMILDIYYTYIYAMKIKNA